jgi:hypothetical protein
MKPVQTELFPELETKPKRKPAHTPLEKNFMQGIMDYASKLGLPNLHVENYCGNSFYSVCECCGHKQLVTCRATNNKNLAGMPDILFVKAGIEVKRSGMQPNELQIRTHEKLKKQGIPVITVSPENTSELHDFMQKVAKK